MHISGTKWCHWRKTVISHSVPGLHDGSRAWHTKSMQWQMPLNVVLDAATTFSSIKEGQISSVLQGDDDMGLPLPTRDYSSLEIHVFAVLNTFIPLVSVYTLHYSTGPWRENSQVSLWIDQSSWECLQEENVFAFSSAFLNCFWKCLNHKIGGKKKKKTLKELWGETY